MEKIELAVFDMAGTTVDENNVVYKTLRKAISKKGYVISLDFVLEHGAGKEKHQAIIDILKELKGDVSSSEIIFKEFKILLKEAYRQLEVSSYKGVEELLFDLRENKIKVALNTGYDKLTAVSLLSKMGWKQGNQFDVLVTADDVKNGRPAPDMILKAMELTGVKDSILVLKVGDSIIDIEEGKNAKCGITIGVTTGAHNAKQLKSVNPTYVLDSLTQLKDYIL